MAAFSADAFSINAFSPNAFDFGSGPAPSDPVFNTPGFKKLRGLKAPIRGETEDQKLKRRIEQGIITTEALKAERPDLAPPDSKEARIKALNERLRRPKTPTTKQ